MADYIKKLTDTKTADGILPRSVSSAITMTTGAGTVDSRIVALESNFNAADVSFNDSLVGFTATNVKAAIEALDSDLNNKAEINYSSDITLITTSWVDNTFTSGWWEYTVTDAGVSSSTVVDFMVHLDYISIANDAGMQNICESSSGSYKFYSEEQPENNIVLDVKKIC